MIFKELIQNRMIIMRINRLSEAEMDRSPFHRANTISQRHFWHLLNTGLKENRPASRPKLSRLGAQPSEPRSHTPLSFILHDSSTIPKH